jgi:prepilin-type N-terminal cleavage/methylation domain-containing protein
MKIRNETKSLKATLARNSGFTLIELMVAMTILMVSLILTLTLLQEGIGKLGDIRLKAKVQECARLTMEYYSSLPPDTVFGMSKGAPKQNDYNTGSGGDEDLNSFVNDSYQTCKELSSNGNPVGSKVQLKYTICPGCLAHTNPLYPTFTTCMYFYKLRLSYNSIRYGGTDKHIDYVAKTYTGQAGDCEVAANPNGCGAGGMPDARTDCTF